MRYALLCASKGSVPCSWAKLTDTDIQAKLRQSQTEHAQSLFFVAWRDASLILVLEATTWNATSPATIGLFPVSLSKLIKYTLFK